MFKAGRNLFRAPSKYNHIASHVAYPYLNLVSPSTYYVHPYAHNRAYKYSTPTRGELNPHVTVSGNNARNPPGGLTQHKAEERPHRYGTINKPIPARSRQGSEHARKPNLPNPIYQRYLVIQFIPMHTSTGKIRHCRHHPGGPAVRRAADVAAARRLKRRRKRCVAGAAAAATTACMRDDEQWRCGSGTFAPSPAMLEGPVVALTLRVAHGRREAVKLPRGGAVYYTAGSTGTVPPARAPPAE